MIINIFTIVGGVWSWKKGWIRGSLLVTSTAPALLQSGVRRHFSRRIIIAHRIPLITAFECSFISKYKQSDWFSRFLVMLSQQAQDFRRSVPDPYPS